MRHQFYSYFILKTIIRFISNKCYIKIILSLNLQFLIIYLNSTFDLSYTQFSCTQTSNVNIKYITMTTIS